MSSDLLIYETVPYGRATFHPYDNFDTLTRSMRELTRYADHIARALVEPGSHHNDKPAIASKNDRDSNQQVAADAAETNDLHLPLRPRIDWRETSDGFLLTAVTPGLRKDELKVEVLDASDGSFIEVSGQSAPTESSPTNHQATPDQPSKPLDLRATYRSFSQRVRLPEGVDREGMRAKYEDGLLVVTLPRKRTDNVKRHTIAIN